MSGTPRWRRLAAVLAVALVAAACSEDEPRGDGTEGAKDTAVPSSTSEPGEVEPTTTLPDGAVDVVLRGDGLGVASLGDDPDDAVDALTDALGAPTDDTGWVPASSEYGTCPGEEIRGVSWDHLTVLFTDGDTEYGTGPHLFSWRIAGAPPALGTDTGFGWGATAVDAEDLHPGQVEVVPAEEPFPGFLVVESDHGPITAFLDEHDVVTNLEAGAPCGE